MSSHTTITPATETAGPAAVRDVLPVQQEKNDAEIPGLQKTTIQFKLKVGAADDPLEHEADNMADLVMRMPGDNFIQRKCRHCEEEELQQKSSSPFIQKQGGYSSTAAPDNIASQVNAAKGTGSTIDESTKSFMQNRFNTDFSEVKIHTGSDAAQMNRQLNAKAFTVGNDIYFNEGEYNTSSTDGKHLLAHELTHTLQQQSFLQTKMVQLKPAEQKQDIKDITYSEVIPINQLNWKEFGFNYINPFKAVGYSPNETPNAYANETYKLQKAIITLTPAAALAKYPLLANGIFGKATADYLADIAVEAQNDPESKALFISYGISANVIDRFITVVKKNVPVEPLSSKEFNGNALFSLINANGTVLLSAGDENDGVMVLQEVLIRLNYDVGKKGADGKFGDGTTKALKAFQLESGLPKWAADGILGYKTLRLLDKRMAVAANDNMFSTPNGNILLFKVPVTKIMSKDEALVYSISFIFNISQREALELVNNKDDENKWGWLNDSFKEPTEVDLNRGYQKIGVPLKDYETIATIFQSKHANTGIPIATSIKEAIANTASYSKLYQLNKELDDLRSQKKKAIAAGIALAITGTVIIGGVDYDKLIADKEKERDAELQSLGISLDDYTKNTKEFKRLFASYALTVAFQMLDDNERQASIEMIKYKPSNDPDALDEGKYIKTVFAHLDGVWSRSEKEWWQGISVDQGAGPDEITSYSSLNAYLKKKGYSRHCFKGDCTEPADTVLPSYEYTKFKKREGNAYFIKAFDSNAEGYEYLKKQAETYPVLAYPKLELKNNVVKYKELSPEDIEIMLFNTSDSIKANIKKTREALDEEPTNVYKLKPVIEVAKLKLGILPDTIHDTLVKDAVQAYEDAEFWRNIGMAALGLGLGLLALVSGPVGWAALAAGIAVGSADAYMQYKDITFRRDAANTAFDPAMALSDVEPGYFWFYVSLVFIGLDAFQGLKAVAEAAKLAKATEEGVELANKLITALNKDKEALTELIAKGGDDVAKLTEELQKINNAISKVDAEKLAKQLNVLKHLNDIPQAVVRLSSSLDNPEVLKAFEAMGSLVKKAGLSDDAYKSILKFYAGTGNDLAAELPEMMRLAEKTDWAGKGELLNELLTNPRSQKVMLDLGENQDKMVKMWAEFKALKAAGKATTFTDFLKERGFVLELGKTKSLVEELGTTFSKLPTLAKNQQVLRTIEPELAQAVIDKTLPKRVDEALTRILESDLLGQTTELARAQERMKNSLRLLGAAVETPEEYQQVVRLLKTSESKMAVFEKATGLAGHDEYMALLTKYSKELADKPSVLDEFLNIGPFTDGETFEWLLHNNEIRKLIADNPAVIKILKKCASPCFPINARPEDIKRIIKVVEANKDKLDYARLNQYMYVNRPRGTSAKELEDWSNAIGALEKDFKGTMKAVEMPTGKQIKIPPRFQPEGAAPLKNAVEKLDILIKRGFSPKQLEDILAQVQIYKLDPNEFMEQLSRATAKLTTRPLDNISGIINGLSSTSFRKFESAYYFIRRIGDYSAGTGVDMAERVFSVFDINEIAELRHAAVNRLSAEAAKATGETSVATIEVLDTLASKINGSSEEIMSLAVKAGTGSEENLGRLVSVVEKMPAGKHTVAEVEAKIVEAKALAQEIANAGDKMGDKIWGVAKTGDKYSVGSKFIDETTKKVSGSKAIAFIKGQAEEIAEGLLDTGGTISPSKWATFRKAIESSDLEPIIKNGIIGEMWGKANVTAYRKIFGAENVIEQVTIRIKATGVEAVVDAVIKKDGKVLFKEFKSGSAVLSPGQKAVYEKMAAGLTDELEFAGENAARVWPDASKFSVDKVEIVTEIAVP
ncbi:MAG: DUF4157 domain-containing protein [Bacteroidetes bacterium]|nr:DUF4157 domain-containing protein [Bacteroidota bacterium]